MQAVFALVLSAVISAASAAPGMLTHADDIVSLETTEGEPYLISLPEGETLVIAAPIDKGLDTPIVADIASNATLTLNAAVTARSVVKRGRGRMVVNGAVTLTSGIFINEGTLSLLDASSLENAGVIYLLDGTFEFAGDGSGIQQTLPCPLVCRASKVSVTLDGIIDLKIESPLVVTNILLESGCIFKRGVGTLVFESQPEEPMTLSVSDGTATSGSNGWPRGPNGMGDISSEYWPHPVSGYSGFNVVEGEVLLTGMEGSSVDITNYVSVGLTTYGMRKSASLSVDGISANIASNGKQLNLSVNIEGGQGDFIRRPRLELRNGANVTTSAFRSGGAVNYYGTYPTATVDRSTWTITSYFLPYGASSPQTFFAMELKNGSAVYVGGRWENYGGSRHSILIDRSVMAKNASLDALKMLFYGCDVSVVNGGALYAEVVREQDSRQALNLSFDGGVWGVSSGTLRMTNACRVAISTLREAGMTIPVANGVTVYVARAIRGAGGVVKTGGGNIVFERQREWPQDTSGSSISNLTDSVSLAFEGLFDACEGSVFVESGACRTGGAYRAGLGASIDFGENDLGSGVTFRGGGTFLNASATDSTIMVPLDGNFAATDGSPAFDGVSLKGRVRVEFELASAPHGRSREVAVARFSEAQGKLSNWSVGGVGKGYGVTLAKSSDGKSVRARITKLGLRINLR